MTVAETASGVPIAKPHSWWKRTPLASKELLVSTSLDNSVMRAVMGTSFALQNMSIATKQSGIGILVYSEVTSAVTKKQSVLTLQFASSLMSWVESFRYDGRPDNNGLRQQSTNLEAGVVMYFVEATIGLPTKGFLWTLGRTLNLAGE